MKSKKLYYVDYPELKDIENNPNIRRELGGEKYSAVMKTTS